MSAGLQRRIRKWLGAERSCTCSRTHAVGTRLVRLDDDGGDVVTATASEITSGRAAVVVADETTVTRFGRSVASALGEAGFAVTEHVVAPAGGKAVIPDEAAVGSVGKALEEAGGDLLVGCGSGTINDLCKYAASERGLPYLCCPTAASMNGYTSAIAALKREGLKVTLPVKVPVAIVGNPSVWATAPAVMSAAGLADLLSKYTSGADWRLAAIIEGSYYCNRPAELAHVSCEEAIAVVDRIGAGEPEALGTLMEALILSGIAMAIAGSSSPASGAEHLISHYWDMTDPVTGDNRYHGTQVGIGVLLCATLYEMLAEVDPGTIDAGAMAGAAIDPEQLQDDLYDHFDTLADPVIDQALQKVLTPEGAQKRAAAIAAAWPRIRDEVLPSVPPTETLRDLLRRAGAPTTAAELGVTDRQVVDAVRWSRHLRARYTVFDLAAEIGWFSEERQAGLIRRSGVLGRDPR